MTLQNRITPQGQLEADPARGTLMGNRGRLLDRHGQLTRQWQGTRWISCELEFKGRKRELMQPGVYTELFFLDEATACAAGHRPCFECRRADATAFRDAWRVLRTRRSSMRGTSVAPCATQVPQAPRAPSPVG